MQRSVDFYSEALQRPSHYLIALPADYDQNVSARFPVLFLLHGMDGGPSDWVEKGELIQALQSYELVVVMPDGSDSYYTNAALKRQDRYEDLIAKDVLSDVEQHYRVLPQRNARGIGGISMGGYGAIKIALKHPDIFAYAAGISAALDAPRRGFAPRRIGQSLRYLRIFGAPGSSFRRTNDVFLLTKSASPLPYLFLVCGKNEPLLSINREFITELRRDNISHEHYEYNEAPGGGHSWDSWKTQIPEMLNSAKTHLAAVDGH